MEESGWLDTIALFLQLVDWLAVRVDSVVRPDTFALIVCCFLPPCFGCCTLLSACRSHLQRLCQLVSDGQLAVVLDTSRRFVGLSAVPDAVDLLQSGNSSGKVVVHLSTSLPDAAPAAAKL